MRNVNTVKINFKGGIIPPLELQNTLMAISKFGLLYVRFGLRQQLLFDIEIEELDNLTTVLDMMQIQYEVNKEDFPNISSSFPAEEAFINDTWLKESIYKDILDSFKHSPRLKINISDSNQSFSPLLTGNINWVAAPDDADFWYLFIRFPKTNIVYEWKDLVASNDIAGMSLLIEETILKDAGSFYDNEQANGDALYEKIKSGVFKTKPVSQPLTLPQFNLPYYEGINRYQNKYWLVIYRRDELFSIKFLLEVCQLCIDSGIEQICSTSWKSILIKDIEEKYRKDWNYLLDKHQINVRHAANELNFQVEDNSFRALQLKNHLVKYLNDDDTRTFGVCVGIKTRRKSEVFSSILVRRRPLIPLGKMGLFYVYDILCAKDYNPNERTDFVYSSSNPKFVLAEQLRRAVLSYYGHGRQM